MSFINFKRLVTYFFLIFSGMTHADLIPSVNSSINSISSIHKFITKTEIIIENDSNDTVWVSANGGSVNMLRNGSILRLFNDEEVINQILIKMSKTPVTQTFFNELVPNHSTLKVKDYLPQ